MSAATSFVSQLRDSGVVVELHAGRVRLEAPRGEITPARLEELKGHKAEVIADLVAELPTASGSPQFSDATLLPDSLPNVPALAGLDLASAVFVDVETVADPAAGLTLNKMALGEYVDDPRTELLSVAIALGAGPVVVYDIAGEDADSLARARRHLVRAAADGRLFVGHNITFDALVLSKHFGIEIARMFDTAAYARFKQIKARLSNAAAWCGCRKLEAPEFSKESYNDRALVAQMRLYNAADVALTRRLFLTAASDRDLSAFEVRVIDHSCRLSVAGVRMDGERAGRLIERLEDKADASAAALREDFGFDPGDVNKHAVIKHYIGERFGVAISSISKKNAEFLEARRSNESLDHFALLREDVAELRKAAKKLARFGGSHVQIYDHQRYYGSHTGRYAGGRGEFGGGTGGWNLQGLPKGSHRHPELGEIRSLIVPATGCAFVGADLKTIEPRVLAWLADEDEVLQRFRAGEDLYVWFVRLMQPDIEEVTPMLRTLGKIATLGLGFGMGARRFEEYVRAAGLEVDDRLVQRAYETYQQSFRRIVGLREKYWRAFEGARRRGEVSEVGKVVVRPFQDGGGSGVAVALPTGRPLYFRAPRAQEALRWGRVRYEVVYQDKLTLDGEQVSGHPRRVAGHTLVENVTQAVARDVLMAQVLEVEKHGLRVVMTIHDEVLVEAPVCGCGGPTADHDESCEWAEARDIVSRTMSSVPDSLEMLNEIPVACEISESVYDSYGK